MAVYLFIQIPLTMNLSHRISLSNLEIINQICCSVEFNLFTMSVLNFFFTETDTKKQRIRKGMIERYCYIDIDYLINLV
jgi:hypothetical protein